MVWEYYLALGCLAIGTYFDVFNKRMIPDIIWEAGMAVGILGLIFYGFGHQFSSIEFAEVAVVSLVGLIIAKPLGKFGILGGADIQALILLTFIFPFGESLFIMNNSFLIAGILLPPYFIYKGLSLKDWGNFKMPFILFMYLGTLAHMVIGNWFLKIMV